MMRLLAPQPPPTRGQASTPITIEAIADHGSHSALVLRFLSLRLAQGQAQYGTPLMTHNGRDPYADMAQELADLIVYTTQAIRETQDLALRASLEARAHRWGRDLDLLLREHP